MKISARNVLSATVTSVTPGAVDIIKASNVMIGVD
jgi:molybdopterin-binding protein